MALYNIKPIKLYKIKCPSCEITTEISNEDECRYDFIERLKRDRGWGYVGEAFVCQHCSSQKRKSLF